MNLPPGFKLLPIGTTPAYWRLYFNSVLLGELLPSDDGYVQFWPELRGGYWSSQMLRAIAGILDEINGPWDAHIQAYFSDGETK